MRAYPGYSSHPGYSLISGILSSTPEKQAPEKPIEAQTQGLPYFSIVFILSFSLTFFILNQGNIVILSPKFLTFSDIYKNGIPEGDDSHFLF